MAKISIIIPTPCERNNTVMLNKLLNSLFTYKDVKHEYDLWVVANNMTGFSNNVNFAIKNFPIKMEKISLPLKTRPGITNWDGEEYDKEVEKACRIYPPDNDSEGFFLAKMTLLEEVK